VTSRQLSIATSINPSGLQALAQGIARTVEEYSKVSAADLENVTDFPTLQTLHFAQDERHPMAVGQLLHAVI